MAAYHLSTTQNKANSNTPAARFNTKTMRAIQRALDRDPESDIIALLAPGNYSKSLLSFKNYRPTPRPHIPENDLRARLDASDESSVLCGLSSKLSQILTKDLSASIVEVLAQGEILYRSAWAGHVMVYRITDDIVVKVTNENSALTEYGTLAYLKEYLPSFPAPIPHGVVRIGVFCLLFTSFVPGVTLEKKWPRLNATQKSSIRDELDGLFSELKSLTFPADRPLGGVRGEGCKDARRATRISPELTTVEQFEDFVLGNSRASPMYTKLLRDLLPPSAKCVFTHGDVRPANIMVAGEGDLWKVVGILDWEFSGFYPDYWECIKATNNLKPSDTTDWYNYLPALVSPRRYPTQWLIDRVMDRSLANS